MKTATIPVYGNIADTVLHLKYIIH